MLYNVEFDNKKKMTNPSQPNLYDQVILTSLISQLKLKSAIARISTAPCFDNGGFQYTENTNSRILEDQLTFVILFISLYF